MAHSLSDSNEHHPAKQPPSAEEFATRLFSVVMFGVCAVILMMVVFGIW